MAKRSRRRQHADAPRKRQLSVMVINRIRDTMALISAIESNKAVVAANLAERYAPELRDGETLPDWILALELTGRDLLAALKRLIELDDQVDRAAVEHEEVRLKRLRLVRDELYPRVVTVRGSIDLAFGRAEGRDIHFMKGRTPRRTDALERQVRLMLKRLTDRDRPLPPPKNPHAAVDRDGWVEQLEPGYLELVTLNRSFGAGAAAVSGGVVFKRTAMKAFDDAYVDALGYVAGVLRTAGFGDLIKKLKPYYQRRRLRRLARRKQAARAAAAAKTPVLVKAEPAAKETARVPVPQMIARWLEKNRLFGT